MMDTYTLKHYTDLLNRHQRLESRGATRTVVMHRSTSLTVSMLMSYRYVAKKKASLVHCSSSVISLHLRSRRPFPLRRPFPGCYRSFLPLLLLLCLHKGRSLL